MPPGAGRLFRSGPGRRRAPRARIGSAARLAGFWGSGGQPAVLGTARSCGYFPRACLALQRSATAPLVSLLAAATARRRQGGATRRGRGRLATRRSANEVSLVGEVGLVTRVLFRPLSRPRAARCCKSPKQSAALFIVPEAPDARRSCTQAFEPVQDAAVSWERSHNSGGCALCCQESAAERRDADQ